MCIRDSGTNDFNYYFYRTSSDAECDLVIEKGLEIAACVEIKFTDTPSGSRGLTQSVFDLRSKNNFIIVPDCKSPYTLKHDIIVCSLIQFFVLFKKTLHEEN